MGEASFGGSVPEVYDSGLVPLIFEEYAADIAGRVNVPEGGRVLELACGTGVVTRQLRATLPARVGMVSTDINPDMMKVAQRSLESSDGVVFQQQDATALDFDDETFDAVVCQFGVMFFPDKGRAYAEAARVLRPGGSFLFNVWSSLEDNPLFGCAHDAVVSLFPDDPPQFLRIPFGYHDVDEITAATTRAGFDRTELEVLRGTSRAPSARNVATTFATGTPLAPILADIGTDRAIDVFEDALVARFGEGPIQVPMQAIVFSALR